VVTPAVYDVVIRHARTGPVSNRFRYRARLWLVDLADLPVLPRALRWAARFDAADHVGDPRAGLRDNIAAAFEAGGVDVTGCRLLMLAHARGLGHGFNPLSVHWAVRPDGAVAGVVAEVHNTYGGRHAYVLTPDAGGNASVDKRLYVSPFHGVDGHYRIRVTPPGERIDVSVTLISDSAPPFVATLAATRRSPQPPARAALATAAAARRTSLLIRWQGVRLWARGLAIQPRPAGLDPEPAMRPRAKATAR
jgi:DUF1365 family protein